MIVSDPMPPGGSRMTTERFLDTNVLVYAFARDDRRWHTARALVSSGGVFNVQVANEFVDVLRRKHRWPWGDVAQALDDMRVFLGDPLPLTYETHARGLAISSRYGFRIFDSLLLTSAKLAGCTTFYSEDMRHGQVVDGVTIVNPFLP